MAMAAPATPSPVNPPARPQPSSVYIASPEGGDTGKSTIALGVLQMLCASAARVGVFRPIARSTQETDYILELLLEHTTADIGTRSPWGGSRTSRSTPIPTARSARSSPGITRWRRSAMPSW